MTVNIGESVLLSYFKYVQKCPICYTNWRIPKGKTNLENVKNIYDELYKKIDKINEAFTCRGKQRAIETILNETEIDVIGFKDDTVYIADVAFHSNGLDYGDNEERVFKKLVKFCLVCLQYFPDYKSFEIMFASPIVDDDDKKKLDDVAKNVEDIFKDYFKGKEFNVKCELDKDFSEHIIKQLVNINENITEEDYFLRSLQLLRICNVELPKYDGEMESKVEIHFIPNKVEFIEQLMKKKIVKRKWYFNDDSIDFEDTWNAANLVENIKELSREDKIKKIKNNVQSCSKYRAQYESELSFIELVVE